MIFGACAAQGGRMNLVGQKMFSGDLSYPKRAMLIRDVKIPKIPKLKYKNILTNFFPL
jgi:hypothetical protein